MGDCFAPLGPPLLPWDSMATLWKNRPSGADSVKRKPIWIPPNSYFLLPRHHTSQFLPPPPPPPPKVVIWYINFSCPERSRYIFLLSLSSDKSWVFGDVLNDCMGVKTNIWTFLFKPLRGCSEYLFSWQNKTWDEMKVHASDDTLYEYLVLPNVLTFVIKKIPSFSTRVRCGVGPIPPRVNTNIRMV